MIRDLTEEESGMNNRLGLRVFVIQTIRYPCLFRRLGFWYCSPSGGPVLKEDANWRTISGVYTRIGSKIFSFQWRRFWRD